MPNNYVLLDRIELNNTAASVTFDNIPQSGYTDLKIVMSTRSSSANVTGYVTVAFNGSTANFSIRGLYGTGSGVGSFTTPSNFVGELVGNGSTASTFSNLEMYIPNYRSSNFKSYSVDSVAENNATQAQSGLTAGVWSQTAAITSVTFTTNSGDFLANSTFSLYGIAQVGTTPAIAPKASGGNVIGTDGTYWYHAFLSNGTFTPQTNITADVLVVAGGGGSPAAGTGAGPSGGGGAGGVLAFSSQALTATNYTCTVGAGGANTTGVDSQFAALTLVKGGGIGGTTDNIGGTGGSGGGSGGRYTSAGGAATSGQGSVGGVGFQQSGLASGGGGGKGQAGWGAVSNAGGYGGDGTNAYSSWLSATALGVSGYIAGGGAGMSWYSGVGGIGGAGGGGNGANNSTATNATNGVANTGSGGGGSSYGTNGGSGVIIIRYPVVS